VLATDGNVVCGVDTAAASADSAVGRLWAWRASDGGQLWRSDAKGNFGAPAVAGGVVYAVSVSGELLALRASDGVKLWDYPANPRTVPVVAGGLVYVGNSAGELVALRASDGKPIWQFPAVFPLARSWSATRCLSATAPGSTRSAPDTAPAAHAAGCRARRACSRGLCTH